MVVGLFLIAVYLFLCYGAGKVAEKQGRSLVAWAALSIIITPFPVVLLLLLLGESTSTAVRETSRSAQAVLVRCKSCQAAVKETADFCPSCGRELEISAG